MRFSATISEVIVHSVELDAHDREEAITILSHNEWGRFETIATEYLHPVVDRLEPKVVEGGGNGSED